MSNKKANQLIQENKFKEAAKIYEKIRDYANVERAYCLYEYATKEVVDGKVVDRDCINYLITPLFDSSLQVRTILKNYNGSPPARLTSIVGDIDMSLCRLEAFIGEGNDYQTAKCYLNAAKSRYKINSDTDLANSFGLMNCLHFQLTRFKDDYVAADLLSLKQELLEVIDNTISMCDKNTEMLDKCQKLKEKLTANNQIEKE